MTERKNSDRLVHVSAAIAEFFQRLEQRQRRRRDPPHRRKSKSKNKKSTLFEVL